MMKKLALMVPVAAFSLILAAPTHAQSVRLDDDAFRSETGPQTYNVVRAEDSSEYRLLGDAAGDPSTLTANDRVVADDDSVIYVNGDIITPRIRSRDGSRIEATGEINAPTGTTLDVRCEDDGVVMSDNVTCQ